MRRLFVIALLSVSLCGCAGLKEMMKTGTWSDYYGQDIEDVFKEQNLDVKILEDSR